MFTNLTWNALGRLHYFFKALRHLPPFHWDPVKKQFILHPSPNYVLLLSSLLNLSITWCVIPIYAATSRIYGFGPVIPVHQVIFLVLTFFIGYHAVGIFISSALSGWDVTGVLNELMKTEKYLRGET